MDRLAEHLGSMQKLGTHSAAQYVLCFLLPFSFLLVHYCFTYPPTLLISSVFGQTF
jgi:hypothetical protein